VAVSTHTRLYHAGEEKRIGQKPIDSTVKSIGLRIRLFQGDLLFFFAKKIQKRRDENMTEIDTVYLVLELYHNPYEYSSAEGRVPIVRAVCRSIESAAEIIGKHKITELQSQVDKYRAGEKMAPFAQRHYVVKTGWDNYFDVYNLPKMSVKESQLSAKTDAELRAVTDSYNNLHSEMMKMTNDQISEKRLEVDPNAYRRDRKAREYEMMQRMHIRPLWRTRVATSFPNSRMVSGSVPGPATPISITNATNRGNDIVEAEIGKTVVNDIGNVHVSDSIPTFRAGATPTLSAPSSLPRQVPVTGQKLTPINTNIPLAPVIPGAGLIAPTMQESDSTENNGITRVT